MNNIQSYGSSWTYKATWTYDCKRIDINEGINMYINKCKLDSLKSSALHGSRSEPLWAYAYQAVDNVIHAQSPEAIQAFLLVCKDFQQSCI